MNEIQQQQSTQAIRAATICYMNHFEKSRENCPGSDSFTIKLQFYNVAGLCTIRAAGTAGSFIFLALCPQSTYFIVIYADNVEWS